MSELKRFRKGMKLISFDDHEEGDDYIRDSIFVFGRKLINSKLSGCYVLFNSILECYKEYTCPDTFKEKMGWCSYSGLFMFRNNRHPNKKYRRFFSCFHDGIFYFEKKDG